MVAFKKKKINLGRRMKKKKKYLRFLQDITGLPSLASKTQSRVQLHMWTRPYTKDAIVGTAGRRSRGWRPKDIYVRGRKREAITTGGQGSQRGKREPERPAS